jgi:hypothetical protein
MPYASDDNIKMACPPEVRKDIIRLTESIAFWRPAAENWVNDQIKANCDYQTPLPEPVLSQIMYATSLYAAHLILTNDYTQYNVPVKTNKDGEVISLAQQKVYQALGQIKNFIAGNYFEDSLPKRVPENTKAKLVKIGRIDSISRITSPGHDYI